METNGSETKEFRDLGGIVLSPSAIGKFYNEPSEWYQDRTGRKPTFDGGVVLIQILYWATQFTQPLMPIGMMMK